MNLSKFIESFCYKIVGGSEYCWSCFGPNARYLDFESEFANGSVLFDSVNQTVYEATVDAKSDGDDRLPGPYRWFNPVHKNAFYAEAKERGVEADSAWDDTNWIDLEVVEDFLEKAKAIFENRPFDKRVSVPLEIEDDLILHLALEAHKRDITLNKMVEFLLETVIADKSSNTQKDN